MSEFLWQNGPVFIQTEHFKISTDSVLLANFVNLSTVKKAVDLGCASGIIGLILLCRSEKLSLTGIEILPEAAEIARENLEKNGFSGRSNVILGDIRDYKSLLTSGSFDLVVSNPPYFPVGSGKLSPDEAKAGARFERDCSLTDICRAAAFLCRSGGKFALVHRPDRLSEIFVSMTAAGFEPKRLRMVQHTALSEPGLVLVEGRRDGKPGLKIEKPLILYNPDGTETDEVRQIYRRE